MRGTLGYVRFAVAVASGVVLVAWAMWQIIRERRLAGKTVGRVFYGTGLLFLIAPPGAQTLPGIRADGTFWLATAMIVIGMIFDAGARSGRANDLSG